MDELILISRDIIGERMAGPAIRYLEMAKALAKNRKIHLLAPTRPELSFPNIQFHKSSLSTLKRLVKNSSAIISQTFNPLETLIAKNGGVPLILDAYDPLPIESIEFFKYEPIEKREKLLAESTRSLIFSMQSADFVLCANERQKDLWTGLLLSIGKISPQDYDADNNFNQTIGLVPFGISQTPPERRGEGMRSKFHFREKDRILLWGGGVWNWFDPLTLIKAVAKIRETRDDLHLVFMGLKHPNPFFSEMKMTQDAIELSKNLNLTGKAIHFNFGWTPYEERQNYLLDATLGVSTHFNHAETRYSFRTRLLDCIWAKLPMVVTKGDQFAELIEKNGLGIAVEEQNPVELAQAINHLSDCRESLSKASKNIEAIQTQFYWDTVIKPIEEYLMQPKRLKNTPSIKTMLHHSYQLIRQRGLLTLARQAWNKL